MPLTDLQCRTFSCPLGKRFARVSDSEGMYLEVVPSGGRYWRLKYRIGKSEKRLSLGIYPQVSLAEARRLRDTARESIAKGVDPVQLRREARLVQVAQGENTLKVVAMQWLAHWRGNKSPRHVGYVERRLEADVFPFLGAKPISEVTAVHLLALVKTIERRGAMDVAKRALETCGQIFRYAVAHGQLERNPAADIKPGDALKPRRKSNYARVSERELPHLLISIEGYQGTVLTRLAMKLMCLTFVRTTELIEAPWSEFDLERAEWRIPAERMKINSPHIVPLSKQSLEILLALRTVTGAGRYVFRGERDHQKPMSNGAILGALKRMGYAGRMTGHGFRGLASTLLHERGQAHHVIEIQLAHLERNSVSASYNHALYLNERRQLMQFWADEVDAIRGRALG